MLVHMNANLRKGGLYGAKRNIQYARFNAYCRNVKAPR